MLARRAAKLFAHVKDVLQAAKLSSAIGVDYATMLRANLLTVPADCAAVPAAVFQGEAGNSRGRSRKLFSRHPCSGQWFCHMLESC